jgi:hypothetical protein
MPVVDRKAGEGLRLVRLGRLDEIQLQVGEQAVVRGDQREIHLKALLDGRRAARRC